MNSVTLTYSELQFTYINNKQSTVPPARHWYEVRTPILLVKGNARISVAVDSMRNVPGIFRSELWFQQDGATCHTARATIDLLKDTFGDRLISRFGPVNWPPRSCDLTPLDYFLWGYVKSLVYADKPQPFGRQHSPCYCRYTATNVGKSHRKLDYI
ncbi:uncharacterized protein TNCV_1814761 [Trichonephila clavipes]|nr:uncharacterized protein TNCV_1814761 [Trichonephila clavipes]